MTFNVSYSLIFEKKKKEKEKPTRFPSINYRFSPLVFIDRKNLNFQSWIRIIQPLKIGKQLMIIRRERNFHESIPTIMKNSFFYGSKPPQTIDVFYHRYIFLRFRNNDTFVRSHRNTKNVVFFVARGSVIVVIVNMFYSRVNSRQTEQF